MTAATTVHSPANHACVSTTTGCCCPAFRTPLLRGDGTTGTAAGAAGPDAANSYPLPREKDVADAHPLAPPRVKQRPRRATSAMATTAAKSAATAASARRRASTPATRGSSAPLTSGGVDVSDYDPLVAAFGGVSAHPADRSAESGAAAADPLSELWMPPPPPSTAAALLGGEGDVGVVDSAAAAPAPAVRQALFDSEERVSGCASPCGALWNKVYA